ncbi:hypothetical protein C8R45DRAFT_937574 [Mycena sanguinolenta]|nr:hypothetical protein C8R45DRAFT_937574 [Mycena sanguinolenta]
MCDEILRDGGVYTRREYSAKFFAGKNATRSKFRSQSCARDGSQQCGWSTCAHDVERGVHMMKEGTRKIARLRIRRVSAVAAATVEPLAAAAALALAQLPATLNCLAAEYRAIRARDRSKRAVAAGAGLKIWGASCPWKEEMDFICVLRISYLGDVSLIYMRLWESIASCPCLRQSICLMRFQMIITATSIVSVIISQAYIIATSLEHARFRALSELVFEYLDENGIGDARFY